MNIQEYIFERTPNIHQKYTDKSTFYIRACEILWAHLLKCTPYTTKVTFSSQLHFTLSHSFYANAELQTSIISFSLYFSFARDDLMLSFHSTLVLQPTIIIVVYYRFRISLQWRKIFEANIFWNWCWKQEHNKIVKKKRHASTYTRTNISSRIHINLHLFTIFLLFITNTKP